MHAHGSTPAIEVAGMVKRFGANTAVDGIDLQVAPGKVLGLLGPNGAGKTTVVNILATLLRPDAGSARVCGYDVATQAFEVRQLIGLTGQSATVDADLSGLQNLKLIGRLLGLSRPRAKQRAIELLHEVGLSEAARRPVQTYSGGMRRRLDVAATLVNRPAVVYLDEPTAGLDPAGRAETWDRVRNLAAGGSTVLLTTQYLEEADQLADDIAVIDSGKVVARGTPEGLKRRLGTQALEISVADPAKLHAAAEAVHSVTGVTPVQNSGAGSLHAAVADGTVMPEIVQGLDRHNIEIKELALRLPSLDDVFLALTGETHASSPEVERLDPLITSAQGDSA